MFCVHNTDLLHLIAFALLNFADKLHLLSLFFFSFFKQRDGLWQSSSKSTSAMIFP